MESEHKKSNSIANVMIDNYYLDIISMARLIIKEDDIKHFPNDASRLEVFSSDWIRAIVIAYEETKDLVGANGDGVTVPDRQAVIDAANRVTG